MKLLALCELAQFDSGRAWIQRRAMLRELISSGMLHRLLNNCRSDATHFETSVTTRVYSEDEGITICRNVGGFPSRNDGTSRRIWVFRKSAVSPSEVASHTSSVDVAVWRLRYLQQRLISVYPGRFYFCWTDCVIELRKLNPKVECWLRCDCSQCVKAR